MAKRPEKNSERVEVRLPYSLKQRFLAACERAGDTPSEALRDAMSDYIALIEQAGKPTLFEEFIMRLIHNPLKTAGMALASLGAFALMAAPSMADERLFKALDLDGDGAISALDLNETDQIMLRVLDTDGTETITLEEFRLVTRFGQITADGPISVQANQITINQDETETVPSDLETHADHKDGFDLRLPEGTSLEHDSEEGAPVGFKFKTRHISIFTLDLSEAGQVKLTSERISLEAFTEQAADLGLILLEHVS